MFSSPPRDSLLGGEAKTLDGVARLNLGHDLQLVDDPAVGEGKTALMAKGLFLCHRGKRLAGESAGFGLPVFKTAGQTFFPSRGAARRIRPDSMEKVFVLNLVLVWRIFGQRVPEPINAINEKLVSRYMRRPGLQRPLLIGKNLLRLFLRTSSAMRPGPTAGICRVTYETTAGILTVRVEGTSFCQPGRFILLNEVEGVPFSRLRVGNRVKQGAGIPGWHKVPLGTVVENPSTGVGFSVASAESGSSGNFDLAGGREVASDLNWAGLAVLSDRSSFCYRVCFHTGEER